jgi:hypothetical protein
MLESQNLLDVQLVFTGPVILRDFVDQHRDFRHRSSKGIETLSNFLVQ